MAFRYYNLSTGAGPALLTLATGSIYQGADVPRHVQHTILGRSLVVTTDWQISSDPGFGSVPWQSLGQSADFYTATLPADTLPDGSYYARWRVNYADGTSSPWAPAIAFTVTTPAVSVLAKVWGAGGGGGAVINTSPAREGGNGGILALTGNLNPGDQITVVVGYAGAGNVYATSGYNPVQSGVIPGGRGFSSGSQGGGNGGGGSGLFLGAVSLANALGIAGGGGGGCGNFNAPGWIGGGDGAGGFVGGAGGTGEASSPATGGSDSAAGIGGVTGGYDGAVLAGGNAGNTGSALNGGGGGGGAYGGGGGCGSRGSGGAGGGALLAAGWTRDTTAEAAMTRKTGGASAYNAANASAGEPGRVEITDGNGTTVYSAPGTYTHTVA